MRGLAAAARWARSLPLPVAVLALVAATAARADVPALLLPPNLGRTDAVWVFGRVLEEQHGRHGPRAWRTMRALAGHNLPGAEVEVSFLGRTARTISGHDGEFEVELRAGAGEAFPPGRQAAEVRVKGTVGTATVEVLAPGTPFLLVSDLDDTVAVTNVTQTRKMLESTFLEDAETQPAVPGMAALYRCLTASGSRLVIVSGTPVQLAPRVERFLEKNGFPPAALVLRNMGWKTVRGGYKEPALAKLAERFPGVPFVLVGDSGERDPEIFAGFMKAHPGRVLRAFVRKATATPGAPARFAGLRLFADPAEVAGEAVATHLIPACP